MGRSFHLEPPFLAQFSQRVIDILGDQYPELREKRDTIIRIVETEEQRFNRTLDQGLVLLEQEIARAKDQGSAVLPGHIAFTLHDTYGFPVEVTRELVTEADLVLDLELVVNGTQRTDDYPKIYEHIEIEYVVTGINVKPEAVARATQLGLVGT